MKITAGKKGFTLIEIVITIGILAMASIFILQLFFTARAINQKSNDLTESIMTSISIIETFKSGAAPEELLADQLLKHAVVEQKEDSIGFYIYYDDKWNVQQSLNLEPEYILSAAVEPLTDSRTPDHAKSGLYRIELTLTKTKPYYVGKAFNEEIYSVAATKYFQ